ncbi:hypothetical protein Tco_0479146 [Tanacetum coccineum]
MNKSRQRFWEFAGSNLGNILGVEKSAEQIDADTTVFGEDGEVDFKGEAIRKVFLFKQIFSSSICLSILVTPSQRPILEKAQIKESYVWTFGKMFFPETISLKRLEASSIILSLQKLSISVLYVTISQVYDNPVRPLA